MKLIPHFVMITFENGRMLPPMLWGPRPLYACRTNPMRHCPARYNSVCGERPCARYESEDPWPWVAEIIDWDEEESEEIVQTTRPATQIDISATEDSEEWDGV